MTRGSIRSSAWKRAAFEIQIPVGSFLPRLVRRVAAKPAARNLGSFAVLPFASLSSDPG